ncbi:hypothetical protein F4678DRAFT_414635 [Xylaria arbuscula]|nr:hypothetical protein F4678DRAFT_414635 [Xylaria arbuscula]
MVICDVLAFLLSLLSVGRSGNGRVSLFRHHKMGFARPGRHENPGASVTRRVGSCGLPGDNDGVLHIISLPLTNL